MRWSSFDLKEFWVDHCHHLQEHMKALRIFFAHFLATFFHFTNTFGDFRTHKNSWHEYSRGWYVCSTAPPTCFLALKTFLMTLRRKNTASSDVVWPVPSCHTMSMERIRQLWQFDSSVKSGQKVGDSLTFSGKLWWENTRRQSVNRLPWIDGLYYKDFLPAWNTWTRLLAAGRCNYCDILQLLGVFSALLFENLWKLGYTWTPVNFILI